MTTQLPKQCIKCKQHNCWTEYDNTCYPCRADEAEARMRLEEFMRRQKARHRRFKVGYKL